MLYIVQRDASSANAIIAGSLNVMSGNVNIPTGQNYTITSVALNTEYISDATRTNKYSSSTLAQADAKIAISSTDSTEIDFTYTTGNITAILKDNTIDIGRLKTAQLATANTVCICCSIVHWLIQSVAGEPFTSFYKLQTGFFSGDRIF